MDGPILSLENNTMKIETEKLNSKFYIGRRKIVNLADYLNNHEHTHKGYLPQFEILILPHQLQ